MQQQFVEYPANPLVRPLKAEAALKMAKQQASMLCLQHGRRIALAVNDGCEVVALAVGQRHPFIIAALIMLACCRTKHVILRSPTAATAHTTPHGDTRTNHPSTIAATPRRRLGTQFTR